MKNRLVMFVVMALTLVGNSYGDGVGVNVPLVGRLVGGGNTLFVTALDVSNHSDQAVGVDFYVDGRNQATGDTIAVNGSLTASGQPVARGAGAPIRSRLSVHFEDFVDALVSANLIPAGARDGFIGSTLFVFNGISQSGRAAVTARFYNRYGDGFVGVSLKGREITVREPQMLVAAVLDTRSTPAITAAVYPNMFINNIALTSAGDGGAGPVTVEVRATGNRSGQSIGVPLTLTIGPGQTASVSQILNALQVPLSAEDTVLVVARVTSGNAAIHGLITQVDPVTRDGSAFEMSRGD